MNAREFEFLDSANCLCKTVRETARLLTNSYDQALAPCGLRVTQYSMLSTIERMKAASISDLGVELSLDQTTTTRNVKILEEMDLVERVVHHDPRVKLIKLTARGKQKLRAARTLWNSIQTRCTEALSDQELLQFRDTLRKLNCVSSSFET